MPLQMSLIVLFGGASLLAGVAACVTSFGASRYHGQVRRRVRDMGAKSAESPTTTLFNNAGQLLEKNDAQLLPSSVRQCFEEARLSTTFERYCGATAFATVTVTVAIGALTLLWWAALFAAMATVAVAASFVVVRRRKRQQKLSRQIPRALDVISRAVRAGQTVPAAFQIIADDFESPIAEEFRLCYEQQNLGISSEVALRQLAARTGVMELRILAVALLVQSRSGGSIIELLNNISTMVHKRLRLEMRLRALTGEGRMQAGVLIALPIVVFFGLLLIARSYVVVLFAYPSLIGATIGAQIVGALWIRRCIQIEY